MTEPTKYIISDGELEPDNDDGYLCYCDEVPEDRIEKLLHEKELMKGALLFYADRRVYRALTNKERFVICHRLIMADNGEVARDILKAVGDDEFEKI